MITHATCCIVNAFALRRIGVVGEYQASGCPGQLSHKKAEDQSLPYAPTHNQK